MNPVLLALETSSHIGAVSLVRNGRVAARAAVANEIKLSAWLLPAIQQVMRQAAIEPAQIDAIAYGAGPGAFTGVRTACATAQALAYGWQKPLLAVDSLHALAAVLAPHCPQPSQLEIVIDARMAEVYAASFTLDAAQALPQRRGETTVRKAADWRPQAADARLCIAGSGQALVPLPAGASIWQPTAEQLSAWELQWADGIAAVAAELLRRDDTVEPTAAEPLYVRNNVAQTEAERAQARKLAPAAQAAA